MAGMKCDEKIQVERMERVAAVGSPYSVIQRLMRIRHQLENQAQTYQPRSTRSVESFDLFGFSHCDTFLLGRQAGEVLGHRRLLVACHSRHAKNKPSDAISSCYHRRRQLRNTFALRDRGCFDRMSFAVELNLVCLGKTCSKS